MSILVLIQIVFAVIQMLPQIIKVIHAIIELIHSLKGVPGFEARQALRDLAAALRYAKRFKDTSKLEALHAKLVAVYGSDPGMQSDVVPTPDSIADDLKGLGRELRESGASKAAPESKL